MMISPQLVDQFCLWFAALAPACVVLPFRRALFTIPLGAAIPWITLYVGGYLLSVLDPERDGVVVDTLWILFGWLPSLLYAFALYGLRRLFFFLARRSLFSCTS